LFCAGNGIDPEDLDSTNFAVVSLGNAIQYSDQLIVNTTIYAEKAEYDIYVSQSAQIH